MQSTSVKWDLPSQFICSHLDICHSLLVSRAKNPAVSSFNSCRSNCRALKFSSPTLIWLTQGTQIENLNTVTQSSALACVLCSNFIHHTFFPSLYPGTDAVIAPIKLDSSLSFNEIHTSQRSSHRSDEGILKWVPIALQLASVATLSVVIKTLMLQEYTSWQSLFSCSQSVLHYCRARNLSWSFREAVLFVLDTTSLNPSKAINPAHLHSVGILYSLPGNSPFCISSFFLHPLQDIKATLSCRTRTKEAASAQRKSSKMQNASVWTGRQPDRNRKLGTQFDK